MPTRPSCQARGPTPHSQRLPELSTLPAPHGSRPERHPPPPRHHRVIQRTDGETEAGTREGAGPGHAVPGGD